MAILIGDMRHQVPTASHEWLAVLGVLGESESVANPQTQSPQTKDLRV